MRPGLTVLCITKDQAPKLLRMLQSVQGVADDIVVFDTGSKDLSPGIARVNGARLFQIGWPGSFSEALNLALREVETEWTLRLDTDEWLLPDSGPQIRRLMQESEAYGYYLIRRDLSDEAHWSESWLFRMWRTHPELQFQGFIHEHVPDRLLEKVAGKRKVFRYPAVLMHDGFMGGMTPEKHRRNIELLRKELAARPGQLYYEVELAQTMVLLNEPGGIEMVTELTDRVLDSRRRPEPLVANLLGTALTHLRRRDLDSERTQRILDRAWEWFGASPPMLWAIAQTELRRQNPDGIYRALLRLEELSESGEYEREWTFNGMILREGLWDFLSRVASSLGHEDVAERNRRRLLTPGS
ncbi:MAG TPA: glycosyltransferase [Fimbriimonadaceae bacterium]|nr:glycosyltransferase [Fimbriimonadaceae bacterium]